MNASDVEFDESVVPELLGWPSRITGEDFLELETSFVQAYNDLVNCTQTGAVRFIDNASVSSWNPFWFRWWRQCCAIIKEINPVATKGLYSAWSRRIYPNQFHIRQSWLSTLRGCESFSGFDDWRVGKRERVEDYHWKQIIKIVLTADQEARIRANRERALALQKSRKEQKEEIQKRNKKDKEEEQNSKPQKLKEDDDGDGDDVEREEFEEQAS